jgi:hypothetical protein
MAFIGIEDAQKMERLSAPAGLRLRVADMHAAPQVAFDLKKTMSGELVMRDWSKLNAVWFGAVQTEKKMMFIILTLIVTVAAFNLVSTLVMTVTDKQPDIAILRTLGARRGRRGAGRAEHRRHRSIYRKPVGSAVLVQGYLPIQRRALGFALAGRVDDWRRRSAAGVCRHALSELVGLARETCGGAAL